MPEPKAISTLAPTPSSGVTDPPAPLPTETPNPEATTIVEFTSEWVETAAVDMTETQTPDSTQEINSTDAVTATSEETETPMPQDTPIPIALACMLDMDQDGRVTDADLAALERDYLYVRVTEANALYDLNGNGQIEIGDIQRMVGFLDIVCTE